MPVYKIILIALVVIVFIPTVRLMNEIEEGKKHGQTDAKKQKLLKLLIAVLVAIFLITLGTTMYQYWAAIAAARAGQ